MNNVIPLKRRGFLAGYISQNRRRPDQAAFIAGVLTTMVLPEVVCSVFLGPEASIAFAASALLGSLLGITVYRRFPYRVESCVSKETGRQAPPEEDTNMPNAA
jgi:hypothetical protein